MTAMRFVGTTVCYPLSVSPQFTLQRAMEGISDVGLQEVELVAIPGYCEHLRPEQMHDHDCAEVRALLHGYNVTACVLNVAADLTTQSGVEFLSQSMRVARELDVNTIVTAIEQTATAEGAERFMRLVPSIVSLAETYGIVIALETHGGLITTGVQGVQLVRQVGSEFMKLTYDMANIVYYAGTRPEDDLAAMGPDIGACIAHVHLKDKANMERGDYNFPPFGTGILDFDSVLRLLFEGGYRGALTLEVELDGQPESPDLVDDALAMSIDYLQQRPFL